MDASLSAVGARDIAAADRRDRDGPHGSAGSAAPRRAPTLGVPVPRMPASSNGSVHRTRGTAEIPGRIADIAAPPIAARALGPAETGQRLRLMRTHVRAVLASPRRTPAQRSERLLRPFLFPGPTRAALRQCGRDPPEIDEPRAFHDRYPALLGDRFQSTATEALFATTPPATSAAGDGCGAAINSSERAWSRPSAFRQVVAPQNIPRWAGDSSRPVPQRSHATRLQRLQLPCDWRNHQ